MSNNPWVRPGTPMFEITVGHMRMAEVLRATGKCDCCQQQRTVLSFDTSEGEYGSIDACQECIAKWFTKEAA